MQRFARSRGVLLSASVGLIFATQACGVSDPHSNPSYGGAANGGVTVVSGGASHGGTTIASGGTTQGGALPASGGSLGSGGTLFTGGAANTRGGAIGSGGAESSGGAAMGGNGSGGAASAGAASGGATAGGASSGGTASSTGDFYVSPTGTDTNPGTQASPFLTLSKANQAAKAGATIWLMAGTFKYSATMSLDKKGSASAPIRVWAVSGSRPILDFSSQTRGSSSRGIEITGDYYHVRGIEVMKAGDNGIAISGSHNTVENVILHNNEDTGLQITVGSSHEGDPAYGANNLILNCDSYENLDTATQGENADGFAAKLRIGPGNVFRGCRAWNNADDGWDLFAANDVVQIDDCWAFLNGKPTGGNNPAGDGNGFKLGGAPSASDPDQGGAVHLVTNSASFENLACGFVRNNNPDLPKVSSCSVHDNRNDYCSLTCSPSKTISTTGAEAKTIARNADGSLPAIE